MDAGDLGVRFGALRAWRADGQRAPHKPLLALWAIGRCLRGEPRLAPFELVDAQLSALLARFGPHRKAVHSQYPFWRMRKDGVWEIDRPALVEETASRDATRQSLVEHNIHGGLHAVDYDALRANCWPWYRNGIVTDQRRNTSSGTFVRCFGCRGGLES